MNDHEPTNEEIRRSALEAEATFLLRKDGFDSSGAPIVGHQAKQRRREAALRAGKSPSYFDPKE